MSDPTMTRPGHSVRPHVSWAAARITGHDTIDRIVAAAAPAAVAHLSATWMADAIGATPDVVTALAETTHADAETALDEYARVGHQPADTRRAAADLMAYPAVAEALLADRRLAVDDDPG